MCTRLFIIEIHSGKGGKSKSLKTGGMKKKTKKTKESIEMKRERKAWRTLAIITGRLSPSFFQLQSLLSRYIRSMLDSILHSLPHSTNTRSKCCPCVVGPVCICSRYVRSLIDQSNTVILSGYLNSALNPIIYTVFSQDFRTAFKKILKRLCFIHDY